MNGMPISLSSLHFDRFWTQLSRDMTSRSRGASADLDRLVSHRELNKACHRPWVMFLANGKKSIVCCELNVQTQRCLITAFFGAHTYNLIHRTLGRFVFAM